MPIGDLRSALRGRDHWTVSQQGTAAYQRPGASWHAVLREQPSEPARFRWHIAIIENGAAVRTLARGDPTTVALWVERLA